MQKHRSTTVRHILPLLLTLILCCSLFSSLSLRYVSPTLLVESIPTKARTLTVVLDAGHGGEDGGAVSADGLVEKDVNLAVVLLLRDMLVANGIHVVLTRETDTLLYDKNADYEGRKKALDAAERLRIAHETPDCIFVSIHMNTYPLPTCRGMQVWYSSNNAKSAELANCVQETAKSVLQPDNNRRVNVAGSGIYLMHHLSVPAVLVECGFLSTPDEAALLATEEYQRQLAFTVFCGILSYMA